MRVQYSTVDLFQGSEHVRLLYRPEAIQLFIQKLIQVQRHSAFEQRSQPRHSIAVSVEVCPVNEELERTGELFKAMTKDISSSGICILHTRPIEAEYLAVKIHGMGQEPSVLLLNVVRNRLIGRFYEVAGNFVSKVELA